jgi:hypothetical protein
VDGLQIVLELELDKETDNGSVLSPYDNFLSAKSEGN